MRLIAECGVAETFLQNFDAEFAAVPPLDFLNQILRDRLHTRLIVVGEDYRFGRHGRGDVALLQQWAAGCGIEVIVVRQVRLSGEKISSSRIRSLIDAGDLTQAASLLGRPYRLSGTVVTGRGLGRQLGFPTANLLLPPELACPAYGVYATRSVVGDRVIESITNIGLRPTVSAASSQPVIETHLYDSDFTLYGQPVSVDFLQRIRPEINFGSLPGLADQVQEDLQTVREWHLSLEQCYEKARIKDIPLYLLPTRRFAQAALHVVFYCPLDIRRTTCQTLMMQILSANCRRYPTRTSLAEALDNLYGSSIEANLEKQGNLLMIDLAAEGLMHWTDGSSPFRETCALLFDMLLDPLLGEDGLFDPETVETERQNLLLEMDARENDRGKFAYDRCLDLFCGSQVQGMRPGGDREIMRQVTREELMGAYRDLLRQTSIALYLGGQIDPATIEVCLDGMRRLPDTSRPVYYPAVEPSPFVPEQPANLVEHREVEQARLVLAYTGLPPYFSHRSIDATFLNSMLGGDVHSLLFDVVREKLGLAYSVYSMNQRLLSALFVMAGVAADQVGPALAAIREQVANLAAGQFDQTLFSRAGQMIEAAVMSVRDELPAMLGQQIVGRLYGRMLTRDESLSLLHEVTPDRIISLAGQLRLVTCYILTGPGQNPDLAMAGNSADDTHTSEVMP